MLKRDLLLTFQEDPWNKFWIFCIINQTSLSVNQFCEIKIGLRLSARPILSSTLECSFDQWKTITTLLGLHRKCYLEGKYFTDLLPHTGISLLSAFITMEAMVIVTGIASKYEECGARVNIAASVGNACLPFTFIQWNPPASHMALMIAFSRTSTTLKIMRYHRWRSINTALSLANKIVSCWLTGQ